MNAIIPDYIGCADEAKDKLRDMGVTVYDDSPSPEELLDRLKDAELITVNYFDLTKELIDQAPHLKYVIAPTVGYEWIDYKYAAEKGIRVINCPTFNGPAVAEQAVGMLIALKRKLFDATLSLKSGKWEPKEFAGTEVGGSKVGIAGYGKIGHRIESVMEAFGATVTGLNSKSSSDDWERLFSDSDIIFLCLPINDRTHHIVNAQLLSLMKRDAVLINVGRGATVDTAALIAALESHRIAGAAMDVFENEPQSGAPNAEIMKLVSLPNVIGTPHIASNSYQSYERIGVELVQNIEACLRGEPINVVNM